ncbi:hypothetical protein [Gemmatirosa kalamazoonensis]|uniref:hypothetical protein n=1 Tax=Gemmatirosa kalamazoonensis TaxID=861299 RepID=UPI00046D0342|nr:hypothetical protein [Gemmatirosa kalamazoonensis]
MPENRVTFRRCTPRPLAARPAARRPSRSLTPRERAVAELLVAGYSKREAAALLGICRARVEQLAQAVASRCAWEGPRLGRLARMLEADRAADRALHGSAAPLQLAS